MNWDAHRLHVLDEQAEKINRLGSVEERERYLLARGGLEAIA